MKGLIEKLNQTSLGRKTILKPGDVLVCSPFHFIATWGPDIRTNSKIRHQPSILRGIYISLEDIKINVLDSVNKNDYSCSELFI